MFLSYFMGESVKSFYEEFKASPNLLSWVKTRKRNLSV